MLCSEVMQSSLSAVARGGAGGAFPPDNLVSLFKKFAYIHCFKNVILEYICIKWSLSSAGRAWCVRDSYGPDFTFYLDYFLFLSKFGYIQCLKNVKLFYVCIDWSVSSVSRARY